jgi:prepilin-type processing-associated H-X9-DG protein
MLLGVRERNTKYVLACPPGRSSYGPGRFNNVCDVLHFWSPHLGGGANFLFADGAVHFLPYTAAPLMPALASRDGGETAAVPE